MAKNPTDATLRNVQAANKKIAKLEAESKTHRKAIQDLLKRVNKLEKKPKN